MNWACRSSPAKITICVIFRRLRDNPEVSEGWLNVEFKSSFLKFAQFVNRLECQTPDVFIEQMTHFAGIITAKKKILSEMDAFFFGDTKQEQFGRSCECFNRLNDRTLNGKSGKHLIDRKLIVKTIAITNQKGGCGKTTTAVNLAAALALKGYRTLIVDLDPQGHATLGFGLIPENMEKTIYDVLAESGRDASSYFAADRAPESYDCTL